MIKKILFLLTVLAIVFASLSVVSGMPKLGVPFDTIIKNEQVFFQYQTKSNLLLDAEVDRIQTLLEKIGESLNARVLLNESKKRIQVIKPNVQMITAGKVGTDKDDRNNLIFERVFGKVKKGTKLDRFSVYTEVQAIPAGKVDFRLLIEGPDQSSSAEEFAVTPEIASTDKSDTTITFDVNNANFNKIGSYKLKLQMKLEGEDAFFTIAEKEIEVTK